MAGMIATEICSTAPRAREERKQDDGAHASLSVTMLYRLHWTHYS